jgi:site-specific DNA-cytosine methylase
MMNGSRNQALGIHVFAGGFTIGVKERMDVDTHLEVHDLGERTSREVVGVDVIRSHYRDWPDPKTYDGKVLAFGNPRCTAFSTVTSSCDRGSHGWNGHQTCDAVQFCEYASAGRFPFAIWESVQQAYTVGKPLLDNLYDMYFKPLGYRLCHLFVNACSFKDIGTDHGNVQCRKRYFFCAYADKYKFNIMPPPRLQYKPALWDALGPLLGRETRPAIDRKEPLDHDISAYELPASKEVMPQLPNGWCLNRLATHMPERLPPKFKEMWDNRESQLAFSLFCPHRLSMTGFAPTMFTGSMQAIHPWYDRGLTAAEFSAVMGWPKGKIPVGNKVLMELCKGIVPAVGQWLAEQVELSLSGHWGDEDWESRYDHKTDAWYGRDTHGEDQKTIDLTGWYPHEQDWSRFPPEVLRPRYPVPEGRDFPGVLNNRWVGDQYISDAS